jgi:glycosyltransferase involved in cell wall biosynthesis
MRPSRIALLTQDFRGGGAEKVMVMLAGGLADLGHAVDLVTVRPEGPFLDLVHPDVRVVTLGPRRVSRSIPALARYLREHRPHALLSSQTHVNVAAVLARRLARGSTRLVLRQETRIGENRRAHRPPLTRLAFRLLPTAYRSADHLVAVSEGLARELQQVTGLPGTRVSAIYNPVVAERDLSDSPGPPPHPWLENRAEPVVLAVGRFVPEKDHDSLLRAFARLTAEREARLVLLGDGPLRNELGARARHLGIDGRVLFAGFSPRPFDWMRHAAVLAHTARWEGFGNVLVEALGCGLPVVATNCPSGPAEILDGGRFGRLVPPGDVEAIARAIAATLDEPPDPDLLRHRARAFTIESIAPVYETLLVGDRPVASA